MLINISKIDFDGDFRVNFYRNIDNRADQRGTKKDQLDNIDMMIINLIKDNPKITQREL